MRGAMIDDMAIGFHTRSELARGGYQGLLLYPKQQEKSKNHLIQTAAEQADAVGRLFKPIVPRRNHPSGRAELHVLWLPLMRGTDLQKRRKPGTGSREHLSSAI